MSKKDWILWLVPVALWCLYATWHFGYQQGYADGHSTAWKRYQPNYSPQVAEVKLDGENLPQTPVQ
jgi:hypothetical protein